MNESDASNYHIVIPARFSSERLPGKMLLDLAGKPLLQHAWERAGEANAASVIVATDDEKIFAAARSFGAHVLMTRADHQSGSDRIAECAEQLGWGDDQLVVNLQGDEPLMPAGCLDQVASLLNGTPDCDVASLYWPIDDVEEVANPNAVKVVMGTDSRALYFSRSPIPYARGYADITEAMRNGCCWNRHLGLYAYRLSALREFTASEPTPLEKTERLEQLRIMERGGRIIMAKACEYIPAGIDTGEDLERVQKLFDKES